jgi:hypothetical protein
MGVSLKWQAFKAKLDFYTGTGRRKTGNSISESVTLIFQAIVD